MEYEYNAFTNPSEETLFSNYALNLKWYDEWEPTKRFLVYTVRD